MANLKVDTISGIGTEGPVLNGGLHFRSKNYLTLPKGTTTERTATSSGISTVIGAIRYNTDSNKMECYVNNKWMIVSTSSSNLDGGARAFIVGGQLAPNEAITNRIEFITIETQGNATDFGDLTATFGSAGQGFASRTRGFQAGGYSVNPHPTNYMNNIDFWTVSSTGNASDFGDLLNTEQSNSALSSATRGIITPGSNPNPASNVIQYVTMTTTGNAQDFGDLTLARTHTRGLASPTRGVNVGGRNPGNVTTMDFITISSLGNAQDFGDNDIFGRGGNASNSIRGIIGGASPSVITIKSLTIATTGDTTNFGDMTTIRSDAFAGASKTRVCMGGGKHGTGNTSNIIDYVNIATEGNAVDFGDMVTASNEQSGCSSGHGGL